MDLTTLARMKAYIGGNIPSTSDAVISSLISRASDQAMQFCGRTFQRATYTGAMIDGHGTDRIMLPTNPVIEISALSVFGRDIPVSADGIAFGYQFDTKFLYLFGGATFPRGKRTVKASFVTGYTTAQSAIIPASQTVTPTVGSGVGPDGLPTNTSGPALLDRNVYDASESLYYTRVGSNPAANQYTFSDGTYGFHSSAVGETLQMFYDYVPGSVEQAVIEMVGAAFERRKNLGVASRSLASETITYDPKMLSAAAKELLQPYRFIIAP